MLKTALRYLNREPLRQAPLLEPLRQGLCEVVYAAEDGVVLRRADAVLLSASTDGAAARLPLPAAGTYQTTDETVRRRLEAEVPARDRFDCRVVVYTGGPLPEPEADIRVLGPEAADFVHAHYHTVPDRDYILGRLTAGVMLGVFVDGAPAGFIGVHDDTSMGMLEVLPAYRRRGLGRALETALINRQLRRGILPWGEVFLDNVPSLRLQSGLMTDAGIIHWHFPA